MTNHVYIKGIVYLTENFTSALADRSTDKIGNMCITAIGELFSKVSAEKDVPLFFGSAYSSLNSLHEFNTVYETKGALSVNPSLFPNTVLNSPSCRAGIVHKITSPIYNISNGIHSGIDALRLAFFIYPTTVLKTRLSVSRKNEVILRKKPRENK